MAIVVSLTIPTATAPPTPARPQAPAPSVNVTSTASFAATSIGPLLAMTMALAMAASVVEPELTPDAEPATPTNRPIAAPAAVVAAVVWFRALTSTPCVGGDIHGIGNQGLGVVLDDVDVDRATDCEAAGRPRTRRSSSRRSPGGHGQSRRSRFPSASTVAPLISACVVSVTTLTRMSIPIPTALDGQPGGHGDVVQGLGGRGGHGDAVVILGGELAGCFRIRRAPARDGAPGLDGRAGSLPARLTMEPPSIEATVVLFRRLTATAPPAPTCVPHAEAPPKALVLLSESAETVMLPVAVTFELSAIRASTKSEIVLPTPEPASPPSPLTEMPRERLWIVADEVAAIAMSPPSWFAAKPGSETVRLDLSTKARTVFEMSL